MSVAPPAPWLEPPKSALRAAFAADRFPQALLVHANAGTGGESLARWLAALLLCEGPPPRPCGSCRACRWVQNEQHPDLRQVSLAEDSKQIRVDQIRELAAELALTSHGQGAKVTLIAPADALNPNAANALLKTLEEPPGPAVLVLVAADLSRLPATIRSRCQRVRVAPPTRAASLEWLEAARPGRDWPAVLDLLGNAPFSALDADVDALAQVQSEARAAIASALRGHGDLAGYAERAARGDTAAHMRAIENWLADRIRQGGRGSVGSLELGAAAHLSESPAVLNIRHLFGLLDQTRELRALLETPVNRALGLEHLLRSFRSASRADNTSTDS